MRLSVQGSGPGARGAAFGFCRRGSDLGGFTLWDFRILGFGVLLSKVHCRILRVECWVRGLGSSCQVPGAQRLVE